MKRFDIDWQFVRRHTLRPAVCALTACVALAAAIWVHGKQHQRYMALTANHDAIHADYDALVDQKRLVNRYHQSYRKFHDVGFIGRESRLDWVETMRLISVALALPTLNYSIEPQLQVIAPVTSAFGDEDIQVRVSRMQLEMGLVHEMDLLRFFDAMQKQAPGLIKVDQCELARSGESSGTAGAANLSANCTIQIYSIITSDVLSGTT